MVEYLKRAMKIFSFYPCPLRPPITIAIKLIWGFRCLPRPDVYGIIFLNVLWIEMTIIFLLLLIVHVECLNISEKGVTMNKNVQD